MYVVMGDRINAIQKARELVKKDNELRMFETPSGRFIITERDLSDDYDEVKFKALSASEINRMKHEMEPEPRDDIRVFS